MLTVVLSSTQRRLRKLLLHGGAPLSALYSESEALILQGDFPDLALVSCAHFSKIDCQNAVFVARHAQDIPQSFACTSAIAVIDSANHALREAVAAQKIPALTCGRSSTDTFTLSSFTSDSAVISLGRKICAFDNSIIEPFELPVVLHDSFDPFDLMATTAVFCLLGQRSPLATLKKWTLLPTELNSPNPLERIDSSRLNFS